MNGTNEQGPPPETAMVAGDGGGTIVEAVARADIDIQIATAKRWPRSIIQATQDAIGLATSDLIIAEGCYYSLPRGNKPITGPSIEMMLIIASTFKNIRYGARPSGRDDRFVYAEGSCHDLESNTQVSLTIARRITDKHGRIFSDDMVAVTTAAACSIAMRNAIWKAVPHWRAVYQGVLKFLEGDARSLPDRRANCVECFGDVGIDAKGLCAKMERDQIEDLTGSDIFTLRGFLTAIKGGDLTVEDIFGTPESNAAKSAAETVKAKLRKSREANAPSDAGKQGPTGDPKAEPAERGGGLKKTLDLLVKQVFPSEKVLKAHLIDALDLSDWDAMGAKNRSAVVVALQRIIAQADRIKDAAAIDAVIAQVRGGTTPQ